MPRVRLTGLILFITTIFLGLAAAATQTWTIKIKRPSWAKPSVANLKTEEPQSSANTDPVDNAVSQANPEGPDEDESSPVNSLQFVQVPVFRPLVFFGILGLILWFVPAGLSAGLSPPKKRRRRRKRR